MTTYEIYKEYQKLQRIKRFGNEKSVYFVLALVSLVATLILGQIFPYMGIPAVVFTVLYVVTIPKHEMHTEQYIKLQSIVQKNQDALLDLIFSGKLQEDEMSELIRFGGHPASLAKEYNQHWAGFMSRLRERQNELPQRIQYDLERQLKIHGW